MLRLLVDQDFDHDILRGLMRRMTIPDVVMAHQVGLSQASDPELLASAARAGRVVVSHDRKSMPASAAAMITAGEQMTGLIIVPRQLPMIRAIDDLETILVCSEEYEWENVICYLPI